MRDREWYRLRPATIVYCKSVLVVRSWRLVSLRFQPLSRSYHFQQVLRHCRRDHVLETLQLHCQVGAPLMPVEVQNNFLALLATGTRSRTKLVVFLSTVLCFFFGRVSYALTSLMNFVDSFSTIRTPRGPYGLSNLQAIFPLRAN